MQTNVLRGRAIMQYGTLAKFASEIGWAPTKVSRILNGKQPLTLSDSLKIADALHIEAPSEYLEIFLPEITQM